MPKMVYHYPFVCLEDSADPQNGWQKISDIILKKSSPQVIKMLLHGKHEDSIHKQM